MIKKSKERIVFLVVTYIFLGILAVVCLLPFIHVFSISLSSSLAVDQGKVSLWPSSFTVKSYEFVFKNNKFLRAFWVSGQRLFLGTIVHMALTLIVAYPLSQEPQAFKARNVYMWIIIFTMLFSGGLIPLYIIMTKLHLFDTIWALILPILPTWNIIMMFNFFRSLPKELAESAYMDGAGHVRTLWDIYIPISKAAVATLTLFTMVLHWNEWFYGLVFMNKTINYPLQTFLYTSVIIDVGRVLSTRGGVGIDPELLEYLRKISNRTSAAAQIFIAAMPILIVYPFLQRHFTKGIVLGSVKG